MFSRFSKLTVAAILATSHAIDEESCSLSSLSAATPAASGCARRGQGLLQHAAVAVPLSLTAEALEPEAEAEVTEKQADEIMNEAAQSLSDISDSVLSKGDVEDQMKGWSEGKDNATKGGPLGIETWIREHLLPQSEKTTNQMQTEIVNAEKNVKACSIILRAAEKAIATQQKTLFSVEAKHHECKLAEEARLEKEEELCGDLKNFAESIVPPTKLKSVGEDNSTAEVEAVVRRNYEFFNQHYPAFMEKRHQCNEATAEEQKAHAQCQAEKREILADFCALKKDSHMACDRYHNCYEKQAKHFRLVKGLVKHLEVHVKKSFKKLSCYDSKLSNVDANNATTPCDTDAQTTHLDITYVDLPVKEACAKSQHTSWNYTFFSCDEDADHLVEGERLAAHAKHAAGVAAAKAAAEAEGESDEDDDANATVHATANATADAGDEGASDEGGGDEETSEELPEETDE